METDAPAGLPTSPEFTNPWPTIFVGERQNWNAGRRPLRGANCWIARRDDCIYGTAHQIGCMNLHSLRRQAVTGCMTFDEAEPPWFIEQRDIMRRSIARAHKQAAEVINASGLSPPVRRVAMRPPRRRAA
jgi:hypothetical protein